MTGLRPGAFARDRRGATAVEFSIVVIPLLLLLFGSIEFGRMIWTRQSLSEIAIAGARCMGLPQTECASSGSRDAAKSKTFVVAVAAKWSMTLEASNVTAEPSVTCGGATGFSKVTVSYPFATAVPQLVKQLVGNPLVVSACFPNAAS